MSLTGKKINLRALEQQDLDFLFQIENDEQFWELSATQLPYSKFLLQQYLANAQQDIYEAKQFRFVIEETQQKVPVGFIDLFDFNPQHHRAGIGILIHPNYQEKGFASEALSILIHHSFTVLQLHQLYANITTDNSKSLQLFQKHNFTIVGAKKDWIFSQGNYKDELLLQLVNE